jgi:hypothetical protein
LGVGVVVVGWEGLTFTARVPPGDGSAARLVPE